MSQLPVGVVETSNQPVRGVESTIRSRLERSDGVLLCLDFDGTLTPIAESPTEPTITEANRRALSRLNDSPRTRIAIISGRELSDLESRIGIPGLTYAGNHGLEIHDEDGVSVHPLAARQSPAIQRAESILRRTLSGVPGTRIEDKGLSLTVHYRQVPPNRERKVHRAVDRLEAPFRDGTGHGEDGPFRIVSGKQSLEIRPAVNWDKGDAVTRLKHRMSERWVCIYVGDDTTDEDAFEALGANDIDVFVGTEATTARYRIREQSHVSTFLSWLSQLF